MGGAAKAHGKGPGYRRDEEGQPQSREEFAVVVQSVISDCLWPHGLQHARLSHPSLYFAQTHVRWVSEAIQSSYPLSPSSLPALNLSQHHGLFQWVSSMHQVAKVLEFQHQSFQWIFRVDFLEDWLVWSPCCLRDSQESSLAPQFESINSSVLSLLYGSTLTSLCDPVDGSTPGFPVFHCLLEFAQIHVHWVSDATSTSPLISGCHLILCHPLLLPSVFPSIKEERSLPVSASFPIGQWKSDSHCPVASYAPRSCFLILIFTSFCGSLWSLSGLLYLKSPTPPPPIITDDAPLTLGSGWFLLPCLLFISSISCEEVFLLQ